MPTTRFAKDKIFAYLTLDDSELMIYNRLYDLLHESVPRPDLVIYLQANLDTLLEDEETGQSLREGNFGTPICRKSARLTLTTFTGTTRRRCWW